MGQMPSWVTNAMNAGMWDANNQLMLGDMTQANAQAEAQNNYNQSVWNYGMAQDQAGQVNANTAWQQAVDQAGLTNDYQNWMDQQGLTQNQLSMLAGIENMYLGAGDTTSTGHQTQTTTTQQSASPAAIAGSVLGAGLSLFAPGTGMFGGLLKGLGGAAQTIPGGAMAGGGTSMPSWMAPMQLQLPQVNTQPYWGSGGSGTPSDRRLKKDIQPIGDGWYKYRYLWDPPGTEHIGVMADEVDPKYVVEGVGGFKYVNYEAMLAGA